MAEIALPGAGFLGTLLRGAAGGFMQGLMAGVNPFKAALQSAASAAVAWGVGHGADGGLWRDGHALFGEGTIGTYLAHGVSQGVVAELRGGSFRSGFVGALAGHATGGMAAGVIGGVGGGVTPGLIAARTTVAAVFGGLAAEASGGSFGDGAVSAAATHLFNYEAALSQEELEAYDTGIEPVAPELYLIGEVAAGRLAISTLGKLGRWLGLGRSTQCFIAGTPVHTKDGVKAIEDIKVGDWVASRDELTGKTDWKPVTRLFRNHDKATLHITLANPDGHAETLGATVEHPFHVEGKGWVQAGALQAGDTISGLTPAATQRVVSITQDGQRHETYNFEVADYHTYFVGADGLWVHNSCRDIFNSVKEWSDYPLDFVARQNGTVNNVVKTKQRTS